MAGFENGVLVCDNVNFDLPSPKPHNGIITSDGQLLIGATAAPHIRAGSLGSSDSSITWTVGAGTITGQVTGGTTVGKTITGDSGGALSPSGGNWNIFGGPGITTSGSGSTLTINAISFTDTSGTFTAVSDTGYFLTAASTPTLPASPSQGDTVIFVADTTGSIVITANTGQSIRFANAISSVAGTWTNSARGDSMTLKYRSSSSTWFVVSAIGIWVPS